MTPTQINELQFDKYEDKMMPCIVQEKKTGRILMQAFVNPEALSIFISVAIFSNSLDSE